MPRFVILRHELPDESPRGSHWDLMFEAGAALRTWAISIEPASLPAVDAQQLADHRLTYLDYEGPLSGDRGTVTRWDQGHYELLEEHADRWQARVHGARLQGNITLSRHAEQPHSWRVSFGAAPTSG